MYLIKDNNYLAQNSYFFYCLNAGKQIPMDKMERFFKIDQILKTSRHSVPKERFIDELEVSLATWKRDLEYLRDRMHAPIEYDSQTKGYRYKDGSDFELPGLWMNEGEIYALLTMQHLVENLQPGMLDDHIKPLMERITHLLELGNHSTNEINKRIRILSVGNRAVNHDYFETVSSATLARQKLQITYYQRKNDSESVRTVSPQRLIHYRENWYLDTWCHLRDGLRTFAIDSILKAEIVSEDAKDIEEEILDKELGSAYGIFSGTDTQTVKLRFEPTIARWVSKEQWHPEQVGQYDDERYYLLEFPYHEDIELIQDILKYGDNVVVLSPKPLIEKVIEKLETSIKQYKEKNS